MKILRNNNQNESQFHIMGLTSEEFYAVKHALSRDARLAADPNADTKGWAEYEIEDAISTWNNFREAENGTIDLAIPAAKPKVEKTAPTIQMVDLGLPSGTKWADRNLGADAPEGYGDYYRWGETTPHEDYEAHPYPHLTKNGKFKNLGDNIAGTEYDAATVNLGKDYRMPTFDQVKELLDCCTWKWTTLNGVKGMKVTGPNGNHIFFPASGYRNLSGGTLGYVGSIGYCWSASPGSDYNGRYLYFTSSRWGWGNYSRATGFPVRAVLEELKTT